VGERGVEARTTSRSARERALGREPMIASERKLEATLSWWRELGMTSLPPWMLYGASS